MVTSAAFAVTVEAVSTVCPLSVAATTSRYARLLGDPASPSCAASAAASSGVEESAGRARSSVRSATSTTCTVTLAEP
eukprot:5220662-Pyramimonas_sp.AAC.1